MITTPTSGAADLPEAGCSKHHLIHCSQCRHDNMVRDLRAENDRLTTQLAALTAGQATAAQAAAPARDLAAVINGAADKLYAAVRCHPNAVDTLIHEALEILDGDREPDATPTSRGQAPAGQVPQQGADK